MARHIYQQHFTDQFGSVISSGTITVFNANSTALATIYSSSGSTASVSGSAVTSGTDGFFSFWIDTDDYSITSKFKFTLSKVNFTSKTYDDVVIFPVDAATTTRSGVVELATDAETITGTDTARAITPANLAARNATSTRTGIIEIATDAETITGTDTARAITPANLAARSASSTRTGIIEIATAAEARAGTDGTLAIVPNALLSVIENRSHGFLFAALTGTDTYTATLSPAPAAYTTNMLYFLVFANANTSATPTVNLNSLGAKTIKKEGGAAVSLNDMPAGHRGILAYDGTDMILINPAIPSKLLYTAASGTNTYTATMSPALAIYETNMIYLITFTNAATSTTPTINLNALGAKTIKDAEGNALLLNDIPAGHRGILVYDGTNMRLLNVRTPRSGTWTPTATLVANLDACVPAQGQWMRVGNTVSGSVEFTADATVGGTTVTRVRLSLPVASDFGATRDASGVSNTANSNNEPGVVLADTANNELEVTWLSSTASNITHRCVFSYTIL